ncbi:MAG: MaoC/PaaZ C-terminal domain-containing protein [Dehalococcoidia bacterium]
MSHKLYYEDMNLGDKRRSVEYHLSEQEIIAMASKWDPQPIHIDPGFAAQTAIGSVFASSVHLVGIMVKLLNESWESMATIAGLGWDEVRFVSPGLPGSYLHVESEVISKRESNSNPDAGIVTTMMKLLNQHDEPVLVFEGSVLIGKRPRQ